MSRELGYDPDIKNIFKDGGFDFRHVPLEDSSVDIILFDPPHKFMRPSLRKPGGVWGALVENYGAFESYRDLIIGLQQAFLEVNRVLKIGGCCIFKWCDTDVAHARVVQLIPPNFAVDFRRRPASKQRKSLTLFWYLTKEYVSE